MKKLYLVSILFLILACTSTNSKDLSLEYYNIANGFLELDKLDKAIEYYKKSLDVDYDNNSSRYNLVLAYVKNSNYDEALENVEILLIWDSKNSDLLSLKAFSLYSRGDLEESLSIYKDIDELKLRDMDIKLKIAKIYYQLESFEKSLELLEVVLEDSSYVEGKNELFQMAGKLSLILEKYSEAAEYYRVFIDSDKSNENVLRELLLIYSVLEDYNNEILVIDTLFGLDDVDDRGNLYFRKGELFLIQNDFKNGYENLKLAKDEGFNDSERIDSLLENPDLVEIQKIRELFE